MRKNNVSFNCATICLLLTLLIVYGACQNSDTAKYTTDERKYADSLIYASKDSASLYKLISLDSKESSLIHMLAYREIGKMYRNKSNFLDAIDAHKKGLTIALELRDTLEIIQAYNNLGTNFRRLGILDEASSHHYEALSYCELYSDNQSKSAKKSRVVSMNGIGNVYLTLENMVAADSMFRMALKGEHELNSALGQAINYANIGAIFEYNGVLDSAWQYYNSSMEYNKEAKSDLGISLCYAHFGRIYEKQQEWDKAIEEYKSGYDLMYNKSDSWHWLESCLSLARVYISKGNLAEAQNYLNQAYTTALKINSLEHIAEAYRVNFLLYEKQGNAQKALDSFIKSRLYADSVSSTNKVNHMNNVRINYERGQRRNEVNLIQSNFEMERRSKRMFVVVSLITLLFALTIIFFLWYSLHMRAKTQAVMKRLEVTRNNFFTNITHEFRTPLTIILGLSKQLMSGELVDGQNTKSVATMIHNHGNSLLELINQLLDISKIKSEIGEPEWEKGDIVAYLRMMNDSFHIEARQNKIELYFAPEDTSIIMEFVPNYINKIMRNLLSNAIKYTPEYGKIFITCKQNGEFVEIRVADTGVGIAKEDISHIFQPFYQGKNSNSVVGSGVGLSMVRQIVEVIGGQITVHSTPGNGAVFTVTLPMQHGKVGWEGTFISQSSKVKSKFDSILNDGDPSNIVKPMVLIVEDNTDIAYYIGTLLQNEYNLFYASNGLEGLTKATDLMPDMIITDLMMPEMDGYELCSQIRSSDLLNHIPIIVITAKSTEEDRIKGINIGADAYLYKPFNAEELNSQVNMLLESRRLLRNKFSNIDEKESRQNDDATLSSEESDFLNKLTDVVYSLMNNNDLNIENISSRMFMSSSQLRRRILSITGETTSTYILQIRISKAKRLLDASIDMPIGDIAMKCGFDDNAHFTRSFKIVTQMTPSQYRKRVR